MVLAGLMKAMMLVRCFHFLSFTPPDRTLDVKPLPPHPNMYLSHSTMPVLLTRAFFFKRKDLFFKGNYDEITIFSVSMLAHKQQGGISHEHPDSHLGPVQGLADVVRKALRLHARG